MTDLILVQLRRTAAASLHTAFKSVGVSVRLAPAGANGKPLPDGPTPAFAVLRDPVDRLQSWFNFRLRSGRPYQHQVWSDSEAATFSVIHSFNDLGAAVTSSDEWLRSVADRAYLDLAGGYRSLATQFETVSQSRVQIVGDVSDLPGAVAEIAARIGCPVPELPTDPEIVDATPDSLRAERTPLATMGLRIRLAEEIEWYEALRAAAGLDT